MLNEKKIIVIIPARGGSKGIPKKNLKAFIGKPLVEHSIDYAKESKFVDQIILSTDDIKIMSIGQKHKITSVERPKEIAGDSATTESAIDHVIDKFN